MATGRTDIGLRAINEANSEVIPMPEAASQTTSVIGAIAQLSSGYMIGSGSGDLTSGWGFTIEAFHNVAASGDNKISLMRFRQGEEFEATLNGVLAATDVGTTAKVTQTSGVPTLTVDTGAGKRFRITRVAPGWAVGDTNARIYAVPFDSFIEQGGGNE